MRLVETCVCGAGFTAEADKADLAAAAMELWRTRHDPICRRSDAFRHSHFGTTAGTFDFGFQPNYTGHGRGLQGPEEHR